MNIASTDHPRPPLYANRCQVIAHRGASRAERENTLVAFARAREMGADAVELDVRRTRDGALVVHHDARLADGAVIAELLRSELPQFVPTLSEALDACAPMWVNIEIKNDVGDPDFDPTDSIADDVMALLAVRPEPDTRWVISSFRVETVDRCREIRSSVPTAWLCVEAPVGVASAMAAKGHAALHPFVRHVTLELIEACHRVGVAVNTWTCDDPDRMAEMIPWGLDGICTNVPDVAVGVVEGQSSSSG